MNSADLETLEELKQLTFEFFKGDKDKYELWWLTENPHLGGSAPIEFIIHGRLNKLSKFIHNQLDENKP